MLLQLCLSVTTSKILRPSNVFYANHLALESYFLADFTKSIYFQLWRSAIIGSILASRFCVKMCLTECNILLRHIHFLTAFYLQMYEFKSNSFCYIGYCGKDLVLVGKKDSGNLHCFHLGLLFGFECWISKLRELNGFGIDGIVKSGIETYKPYGSQNWHT